MTVSDLGIFDKMDVAELSIALIPMTPPPRLIFIDSAHCSIDICGVTCWVVLDSSWSEFGPLLTTLGDAEFTEVMVMGVSLFIARMAEIDGVDVIDTTFDCEKALVRALGILMPPLCAGLLGLAAIGAFALSRDVGFLRTFSNESLLSIGGLLAPDGPIGISEFCSRILLGI